MSTTVQLQFWDPYVRARGAQYRHTIEEVRALYIDWARDHGLTRITAYAGTLGGIKFARAMDVRYVDPDHYFAVGHWVDDDMRAASWQPQGVAA